VDGKLLEQHFQQGRLAAALARLEGSLLVRV
jgi:hypothetical protein